VGIARLPYPLFEKQIQSGSSAGNIGSGDMIVSSLRATVAGRTSTSHRSTLIT
jgi:hypothetical protein